MGYRSKLAVVIFTVGLIPSLLVIIASAYLLTSGIDRIASSGLETSLYSAEELVKDSRQAAGSIMMNLLRNRPPLVDSVDSRAWLAQNMLDLAFELDTGKYILSFSDSINLIANLASRQLPPKPGLSIFTFDNFDFLVFSTGDSISARGCGILLPEGHGRKGKALSRALSVSASLGILKTFSARLLIVVAMAAVALSVVSAIIISGILSRRLARPLAELSRGAELIGRGELGHRVEIAGGDEFARVGESFNRMALEIKENQQKLLEAERLAAWREVARRIAHEIRNPLTPMTVQLYRLEQELARGADPSRGFEALAAAKSQLDSLRDLAGQFSAFAKEPELRKVSCSLAGIIEDTVKSFDYGTGVKIRTQIETPLPNLTFDPQMMTRAIANILKNSIEAMPNGGEIHIKMGRVEEIAELSIRDSGPGFPAEKLSRIDQPYITSKPTGTGLGLAIVKKIIEEHGGSISFFNDCGAVVKITLPIN